MEMLRIQSARRRRGSRRPLRIRFHSRKRRIRVRADIEIAAIIGCRRTISASVVEAELAQEKVFALQGGGTAAAGGSALGGYPAQNKGT